MQRMIAKKSKWATLTVKQKEAKLAAAATPSEIRLAQMMSAHPLLVGRFNFQKCVEGYFPDFSFPHSKLIVELDGAVHRSRAAHVKDARRTAKLKLKGWRVIRFWNSDVRKQPELTLHLIISNLR